MKKILIIDDDPDTVTLLQLLLKTQGFAVAAAYREQQAWEVVEEFAPDLILLDVLLSGADGRDICHRLKASVHRHIPILIFSGHPAAQKNLEGYGADDFLAKPFQEGELLHKIDRHLAGKPQTQ